MNSHDQWRDSKQLDEIEDDLQGDQGAGIGEEEEDLYDNSE
jgi:hypothetical protein